MKVSVERRMALLGAAVLGSILLLALLLRQGDGGGSGPSSLSRGGRGWLVARAYLEARGGAVELLDRPLAQAPSAGTLVLTFPWARRPDLALASEVRQRLARGGDLLVAYPEHQASQVEAWFLEGLDLPLARVRQPAPLTPWGWRRHAREVWRLDPGEGFKGGVEAPEVRAFEVAPPAPAGARVLFRTPDGAPAVFTFTRGRGRVAVVPVAALANGWLSNRGNVDLLETLRGWLGEPWIFDEFHHGLVSPEAHEELRGGWILDLLLVHLLALYLLVVLTLARRFGPPWREPAVVVGTTGTFFLGLGALHHRLRHHSEGASLLLARVAELEGEPPLPETEARRAETADAATFLELARRIAGRRSKRGGIQG